MPALVRIEGEHKTRSGKIMRPLLRDLGEGRALGDVTTVRDSEKRARPESKIKAEQASER